MTAATLQRSTSQCSTVPFWPALLADVRSLCARDYLLFASAALFVIGFVMACSASISVAASQYGGPFYFSGRHLFYLLVGIVAAKVVYQIPLWWWQRYSWVLLGVGMLCLLVVFVPGLGRNINGSSRWIGVAGLTLQPSEIAKFCVVVWLSAYLVRRQDEVRTRWSGFFKPMVVMAVIVCLLLLEPDFGATVVLFSAVIGMMFLSGMKISQFSSLVAVSLVLGSIVAVAEPYRMQRLLSFTNPWENQFSSGYQLTQSLIAFGRGDIAGVGLGQSVQKLFYLPEAHTDFVFAVIAEELGLPGVLAIVALFVMLVGAAMHIGRVAERQDKPFAAYLAYGIAILIAVQAFINIGVNTGLLPTKGLTLPLVSYGGSSLVVVCAMLAVVLRIDQDNNGGDDNRRDNNRCDNTVESGRTSR